MMIHLIRHGKTEANEKRLYCGVTDIPLSPAGITELLELKELNIFPEHADAFFTSNLSRTVQTLELLYDSALYTAICQLAEFNFGNFEMKSYDQLKHRDDYQAWIMDETGLAHCPNGENKQQFTERVVRGYHLLARVAKRENNIVAVTHGGVITCIMGHLFPGIRNFYEWQPAPGRGYSLNVATNTWREV